MWASAHNKDDMTREELAAAKATFPWTMRSTPTRSGQKIQVIDNAGHEVSLFTMIALLEMVTRKMAFKQGDEQDA
jgi:hypothetical protein